MDSKIWLSPPHLSGDEITYIQQAIQENWVAPVGPNITSFENNLQNYLNANKHIVALNSGTSAIHLALILAGVTSGDEVICQSFTFAASANPIVYLGGVPVFVDSEKETWNMCPVLLEEAIVDRIRKGKKPKAIVAVHMYGMPYKVIEISAISEKYNIPIIEDAAEALGSTFNGKQCGSFGTFGILSFNGNKIITTSGGGALVCTSEKTKEKALYLATQAKDDAPHYQHSEIGYNYRLSNILAGIGIAQLAVLNKRVLARRTNYEFYKNELSFTSSIEFLMEPEKCVSNRWLTCMLTPSFKIREQIRLQLESENIESKPLRKPLHIQPVFKKQPCYVNGVSELLFERGLCLPSGSNLKEYELRKIIEIIKQHI